MTNFLRIAAIGSVAEFPDFFVDLRAVREEVEQERDFD